MLMCHRTTILGSFDDGLEVHLFLTVILLDDIEAEDGVGMALVDFGGA